jgi:hypothetical protein
MLTKFPCAGLLLGIMPSNMLMQLQQAWDPNVKQFVRLFHAGPQPKLQIHPRSVLARVRPAFVVFWQCQQNDEGWFQMQSVTAIEPQWLVEVAPGFFERHSR